MNLVNFRIFLKLSCLPSCVDSFLQNGMFQYGEHCYTSQLWASVWDRDRNRSSGPKAAACRQGSDLPSSGLLSGFLNTHLAAGEVRGAKSAEPSSWTYNSAWARLGWAHQFV